MPPIVFQLMFGCMGCGGLFWFAMSPSVYREFYTRLQRRGPRVKHPAVVQTIGIEIMAVGLIIWATAAFLSYTGQPPVLAWDGPLMVPALIVGLGVAVGGILVCLVGAVLARRAIRRFRRTPAPWVPDYEI